MADEHGRWSLPLSGARKWVPLFPDGNSTYWYFAFTRRAGDTVGLKIEGAFGHARYQALTVYDDTTGTDVAALRDVDTKSDSGSRNPYVEDADPSDERRRYTVVVVPEGSSGTDSPNVITYAADLCYVSLFLRVYLPDRAVLDGQHGLSGGVPLLTISAFDTRTGAPAQLPKQRFQPLRARPNRGGREEELPVHEEGHVRFYRFPAAGLYPNPDNFYLVSLFHAVHNKVAVIRFRPPSFPTKLPVGRESPQSAMTRYWSINICGEILTNTTATLADYQAVPDADGYVRLIVGPHLPLVVRKAEGANFLPWGPHRNVAIVYRHLLPHPEFQGSAARVPTYSLERPSEEQAADAFIGDHAPAGMCHRLGNVLMGNVSLG